MKEEDVRIGMKVKLNGTGGDYVVLSEKDYRTLYGNVYTLENIKTWIKITLNACDFEPYIDIENEPQNLSDANNNIEEEIQKSFEEHVKKYGNDFSLFSCYKAGYLAGRKGK